MALDPQTISLLEGIEQRTGKTPEALSAYRNRNDNSTALGRFVTTTANQALGGFGDELLDVIGAEDAAERVRSNQNRLVGENPVASFGASALGFLAPSAYLGRVARVGDVALSRGSRILRGTGVGAGEAAVISAGNADGEDTQGRLQAATNPVNLAIGAGLGGVLGTRLRTAQQSLDRTVAEPIAKALDINTDELVESLSRGDTIERIALRGANNDVDLANTRLRALSNSVPNLRNALGENARPSSNATATSVREVGRDLDEQLTASTRSQLDSTNPDTVRGSLTERRAQAGEQVNASRQAQINDTGVINELVENPVWGQEFKTQLEAELERRIRSRASSDVARDGQRFGDPIIVTNGMRNADETLPEPGVYIKTGQGDNIRYQPTTLNQETLFSVIQNLRTAGTRNLDNSAEGASRNTSSGADLVRAADEATEILEASNPAIRSANARFAEVSAEEDTLFNVSRLFSNSGKTRQQGATNLRNIIRGTSDALDEAGNPVTRQNLTPLGALQSVRTGLREAIDSGKVDTFDESSTAYKSIRDLYREANALDEFEEVTSAMRNRIALRKVQPQLQRALNPNTSPQEVGKALRAVFNSPDFKPTIRETLGGNAEEALEALDEMLDELQLIATSLKGANARIQPDPSMLQNFAEKTLFYRMLTGSLGKALAIAGARTAVEGKVIQNIATGRVTRRQILDFFANDPRSASEELFNKFVRDAENNSIGRNWLSEVLNQLTLQSVRRELSTTPVVRELENQGYENTSEFEFENEVPSTDNNIIEGMDVLNELGFTPSNETFQLEN